jgi:hypothetical protein
MRNRMRWETVYEGGGREGMRSNPLALDTLAAQQFAAVFHSGRQSPEKRLFVAVMMTAIAEFHETIESPKQRAGWAFQELVTWFFSHDRSWPFSFENLCEHLDLSPDCIRHQIKVLLHEQHMQVPADDLGN